jgi:SH3 domain-containing YSC84-like protein 1
MLRKMFTQWKSNKSISSFVTHVQYVCQRRTSCNEMKKLPIIFAVVSMSLVSASFATEQGTVDHCTAIIRDFRQLPEKSIPRDILRKSKGLAIMTVVKAGFIFSGKGGKGVVVARTGKDWSGPSFIATGGAGWGAQIGAQVTDFVFVLNNDAAVRAFSRGGNVTLGADASVAAGPVGRNAEAGVAPTAAVYTYSRSKGLFAGVSLEGAVIATQKEENARYYGREVSAGDILHGRASPPKGAANLQAALGR